MGQDDHLVIPPPPKPEETEERPHRLSVYLSAAALVISFVAASAGIYQGCEARSSRIAAERSASAAEASANHAKTLNDMTSESLSIAKAAASASDKSAQAAADQVLLMRDGNREAREANRLNTESMRGRVAATGVTLKTRVTSAEPIDATLHIANVGQAEAIKVKVKGRLMIDAMLPPGEMPAIPSGSEESEAVLAPGGKSTMDLNLPASNVTARVAAALLERRTRIYVFGVITYETFGMSHETTFCFIPDANQPATSGICRKWNKAK